MAAKKIYDAVCTVGEYTNKQGETKKRYLTVGAVFENENGGQSLKLECVPTNFNGYINFYQPKEKEHAQHNVEKDNFKAKAKDAFSDDIPW